MKTSPEIPKSYFENLPENPFDLFKTWLGEAEKTEPSDPNAMALATAGKEGMPSVRYVLLKGLDERGFVFYTNAEGRKGQELEENAKAGLCFYWKSLRRQVRTEGEVELVSAEEANAYYNSRHRESRIGAWASKQSRPMEKLEDLENLVTEYQEKFEAQSDIPRPPYWQGYRVKPKRIEFWFDQPYRLHKRFVYLPTENGWTWQFLYP